MADSTQAESQQEGKKLEISESLAGSTDCETIYLPEEEIQAYIEKYMKENPNIEIETRYVNPPKVEYTQEIQVRWLRPETPNELPPIIIREVEPEPEKPLRIVEIPKKKEPEEESKPIVIREKPPVINTNPEAQYIYVQKKENTQQLQQQQHHQQMQIQQESLKQETKTAKQESIKQINQTINNNQSQGFFYRELPVTHVPVKPKIIHEEIHSLNRHHSSNRQQHHDVRNYQSSFHKNEYFSSMSHGYSSATGQASSAYYTNVDYNNINNYKQQIPINQNKYNIYNYLYVPNGQSNEHQQMYQQNQYGFSSNSISNRIIR